MAHNFDSIEASLQSLTTEWANVTVEKDKHVIGRAMMIEIVNKDGMVIPTDKPAGLPSRVNWVGTYIQDLYFRIIDKKDGNCGIIVGKRILHKGNIYLPIDCNYILSYNETERLISHIAQSKNCEEIYSYLDHISTNKYNPKKRIAKNK